MSVGPLLVNRRVAPSLVVLLSAALLWPQTAVTSSTADFIRINSPRIVLAHIDLIDGTGVPVKTRSRLA